MSINMMISEIFTIIGLHLVITICTNVAAEYSVIKELSNLGGVSTQTESWPIPEEIIVNFFKTQNIEKIPDLDFTPDDFELFTKGQESEDLKLTAEELLKKNGYPVETYKVITEDDYILTLFRIPSSGEPILLMHGLLSSSDDWVTPGLESGLAYRLADEGFDVWLGNVRGNKYSRENLRLSPDSAEFWDFSWDEMGRYDLPAIIDFILNATQRCQLIYIGHSQGTTCFFVMGSVRPEYNKKVSLTIAMAPVTAIPNQRSPVLNFMKYVTLDHPDLIYRAIDKAGYNEFLPPRGLVKAFQTSVCGNTELAVIVCSNLVFLLSGFSYSQLNVSNLPLVFAHVPSGASTKQLDHYAQTIATGKFETYIKGSSIAKENNLLFGLKRHRPQEYEVENIDTPMALFYSENDWLATEPDVLDLISKLNDNYVIDVYKVPNPTFNHVDFLYGIDVKSLIFPRIIKHIKKSLSESQI